MPIGGIPCVPGKVNERTCLKNTMGKPTKINCEPLRLCCTNGVKDSLFESSMIAGGHEQLDPDEVQDHELVGLQ